MPDELVTGESMLLSSCVAPDTPKKDNLWTLEDEC